MVGCSNAWSAAIKKLTWPCANRSVRANTFDRAPPIEHVRNLTLGTRNSTTSSLCCYGGQALHQFRRAIARHTEDRVNESGCFLNLSDQIDSDQDQIRELVAEVVANGRRALVFSQFVEFLGLLRK